MHEFDLVYLSRETSQVCAFYLHLVLVFLAEACFSRRLAFEVPEYRLVTSDGCVTMIIATISFAVRDDRSAAFNEVLLLRVLLGEYSV